MSIIITNEHQLMDLATMEYPISFWDFKSRHPNVAFGNVYEDDLPYFNYALVHATEPPVGDVVTQGDPVQVEGKWTQTWSSRPYNAQELADLLESAKTQARWIAQDALNVGIENGVVCTFAAGDTAIPMKLDVIGYLGAQHDALFLTMSMDVISITSDEGGAAYTRLRAKRQAILAAYKAQLGLIDASTSHTNVPAEADIRAAIATSLN